MTGGMTGSGKSGTSTGSGSAVMNDTVPISLSPSSLTSLSDCSVVTSSLSWRMVATAFTVRVAPIPAFGTKRIEIEYTELLSVDDLQSYYSLPLKPSQYGEQAIAHLRIDVAITSGFPLSGLDVTGNQFPVAMDREPPTATAAPAQPAAAPAAIRRRYRLSIMIGLRLRAHLYCLIW